MRRDDGPTFGRVLFRKLEADAGIRARDEHGLGLRTRRESREHDQAGETRSCGTETAAHGSLLMTTARIGDADRDGRRLAAS
jgi:hypothetical protein